MGEKELTETLCGLLGTGRADNSLILPVLRELNRDKGRSLSTAELLGLLRGRQSPAFSALASHLQSRRRAEALRCHQARKAGRTDLEDFRELLADLPLDIPLGWQTARARFKALKTGLSSLDDHAFIEPWAGKAPLAAKAVAEELRRSAAAASAALDPAALLEALDDPSRPADLRGGLAAPGDSGADVPPRSRLESGRAKLAAEVQERNRLAIRQAEDFLAGKAPAWPACIDEEAAVFLLERSLAGTQDPAAEPMGTAGKAKALDLAAGWPTSRTAPLIRRAADTPEAQERASLLLTLRFGDPLVTDWRGWSAWLSEAAEKDEEARQACAALAKQRPAGLLLLWLHGQPSLLARHRDLAACLVREVGGTVTARDFLERRSQSMKAEEWRLLAGSGTGPAAPGDPRRPSGATPGTAGRETLPAAPGDPRRPSGATPGTAGRGTLPAAPKPAPGSAPSPKESPRPAAATPAEPAPPPAHTLWDEHILPFVSDNWTMLAGIGMVVVGCSILAYCTWDKQWFIRYTILPALLGCFTAGLARLGSWIERRSAAFRGTADLLRGAAVALLPANFMAMALLGRDPQVTHKAWVLPFAAVLYLVVFGRCLRSWCAAVHPSLKSLLGDTLLLLNGLVLLGPLLQLLAPSVDGLRLALGAGFHAGFIIIVWSVFRFVRNEVPGVLAEGERVPWFFGVAAATTFIQVFLWVHGLMRLMPRAHTYACMVIATGGLVLLSEQGTRRKPGEGPAYGKESFIGYAFILLGLLMGAAQPGVRLASLELAGAVWLAQAVWRRDTLHAWIGLTLMALGGGSIATWGSFPGPWIPALGFGLACAAGAAGPPAMRWWDGLGGVAAKMQASILAVTAVLAVLTQLHYQSPPLKTGGLLLATAALLAWRARQDDDLICLHSTMAVLAVCLPYLGFADLSGRTLHGNNLVLGLSILSLLWIGLTSVKRTPLLLQARSTVLIIYGALAVSAMFLRVFLEAGRPGDETGLAPLLSVAGPLMMAASLAVAAFHSRSLLPAVMGAVAVVILLPELKLAVLQRCPFISWGSGLLSGVCALAMALACFPLARSPRLKDLGQGDLFAGRVPFPWQRRDHTLFTWPLLASAVLLSLKVDTWNLLRNLVLGGVHLKTAAAFILAGCAWTLVAVFQRQEPRAKTAASLGWISASAGVLFIYDTLFDGPLRHHVLLWGIFMNGLYLSYRHGLEPRHPWAADLLADPARSVLRNASVVVSMGVIWALLMGESVGDLWPLLLFSFAQLSWFGLTDGEAGFGTLLFVQAWAAVAAWAVPGTESLLVRLSWAAATTPSLLFLLAIQAGYILLEASPSRHAMLRPLVAPAFSLASLAALAAGAAGVHDAVFLGRLGQPQQWLLAAVVAVTARAQRSGPLALLAVLLGYAALAAGSLAPLAGWEPRLESLVSPWRLGALSLAMAALAVWGERASRRWPRLTEGRLSQGFLATPVLPWIQGAAMLLAWFAVIRHAAEPALRNAVPQLAAPYLAAASMAVFGVSRAEAMALAVFSLFLSVGNVHAVRAFLGETLRGRGLMENHLLCLGLVVTAFQFSLARSLVRRETPDALRAPPPARPEEEPCRPRQEAPDAQTFINRACLCLAGLVLALLGATYFVHPDVEMMSDTRFVLSGLMAYAAGRYFHRASRSPDAGERPYTRVWEGLYHFGVVTAIWCAALMVPWLRNPDAAFPALGLPVLYFYLRCQLGPRMDPTIVRYRDTTATLCFFMLVLYAFRGAFQVVMFPEAPVGLGHYHVNAPFVMALAFVMLHLHGMGGNFWLAFYGGLAMMAGSYFALSAIPGLTPFEHPIPAAWCAVGIGHFWMLFSSQPSPLRTFVQRMAAIDGPLWFTLRNWWGIFLLAATQACVFWGIADHRFHGHMVAPLLLGGTTLLIHQGLIRESVPILGLAGLEAMAMLHADFFVTSFLPKEAVLWALLAIWAAVLLACQASRREADFKAAAPIGLGLGCAVMIHVLYHRPWSPAGLLGLAAAAALAAVTPRESRRPASPEDNALAAALLAAPLWLAYFGQRTFHLDAYPWTTLITTATLLLTGTFSRWVQGGFAPAYLEWDRTPPRLFDHTLAWLGTRGFAVNAVCLYAGFLSTASVQLAMYGRPFEPPDLALILGLYGASIAAWRQEGLRRRDLASYLMLELCLLCFLAVVRRQLMLTLDWWNHEYDVWAGLGISWALAGAKQIKPDAPREERIPLLGTLLAMPVVVLGWVLARGMSPDMVLLVVGVYSLMFAFMAKDDRQSPYHFVAVGGFVAFILVGFWTKLELRAVQAYVIPVGMGVLLLLQMFRDRIAPALRNEIRAVTLLSMLGSAGYYALLDDRYPLAFHMTMLALSVFAMALGSFLRVRLYVLLGLAGLLTDLASILYKVVLHLDRGARITLIGSQVLLFGALLIGGAIVYKTHQDKLNETFERWRGRWVTWE
ncbi:MAG: hypothetical protein HY927_07005 [Elusimicrobia bacterium]|nr:hypothetical protein [Elusimicrobiota bacterium]